MTARQATLVLELRRRLKDRNVPGYWGCNARAWARKIIRELREEIMSARQATLVLMQQLGSRGISLSFDEVNTLRRAELTLQRWAELECGDGNEHASWSIERSEVGIPFMVRLYHQHGHATVTRHRIPDREAGALRRVKAICEAHGLHFYHQTDPRGCSLYVSNEPLPDHNYTRGIACCS